MQMLSAVLYLFAFLAALLGGVESCVTPTASSGDDSPRLALSTELRLAIFAGALGDVGAAGIPGSGWPKGTLPLFFTDTGLEGSAGPPGAGAGEEAPLRGRVAALVEGAALAALPGLWS